MQFIHSQNGVDIGPLRYVHERQWAQVLPDQRQIRGETRNAFVHILERLQIWQVHHGEERLLKGIGNRRRRVEDLLETLLDQLWHFQRIVDRPANMHGSNTQAPTRLRIGEQVVRQQGVQIEEGVAVETNLCGLIDHQINRIYVMLDL